MRLVKPTVSFFLGITLLFISLIVHSQENSPFSPYGIGDAYPQQNIASRGMGGVSSTVTSTQFINTLNPASYGSLGLVTYDFALSIDGRTLLSKEPVGKYKSTNFLPSYLQLGMPLTKPGNRNGAALVFGLRPATRINYSIAEQKTIFYDSLGIRDTANELHEGDGGMNH